MARILILCHSADCAAPAVVRDHNLNHFIVLTRKEPSPIFP